MGKIHKQNAWIVKFEKTIVSHLMWQLFYAFRWAKDKTNKIWSVECWDLGTYFFESQKYSVRWCLRKLIVQCYGLTVLSVRLLYLHRVCKDTHSWVVCAGLWVKCGPLTRWQRTGGKNEAPDRSVMDSEPWKRQSESNLSRWYVYPMHSFLQCCAGCWLLFM